MNRRLVIPTLGTSPHLAAAVASVPEIGRHWELIVVCPAARAPELQRQYGGARVLPESGTGLYGAINDGLRAPGHWDWCAYLNDDDLVTPAVAAELPTEADIVYGRVDYCDAGGRRLGSFPVESRPERLPRLLAAGVPALSPQGTLISRRAFATLGGFDPQLRFCGDFDFWARAARQGLKFHFCPERLGIFRVHPGQLSAQTASASAELAAVLARDEGRYSPFALACARLAFRLRHLPLIVERRRLTGHWRSRSLFAPRPV